VNELDWLNQHRLNEITRRDYDWVFSFSDGVSLVVACLWRLIEHKRIRVTSHDDGQQFGLPTPVDAARWLHESLANRQVVAVELCAGTLDLRLTFDNGNTVEIIPDSSGYEAWTLQRADQQFVAVGGGDLAVLNDNQQDRA
jgi:hypothetical protein